MERKRKMDKEKRKQLVAEYQQRETAGGVYRIWNTKTGTSFIKGDVNLEASRNRFDFAKSTGGCVVLTLSREWEEYGSEAFAFEILEETKMKKTESEQAFRSRLKEMEAAWKEKQLQ